MILTEEQRAAIKLAMKYIARWPFAYKELHARGVLQAMIDSSEHIREPPKMVGFDLEKNRAAIDSAINSLLCEGWDNEASTVRRLVDEIERLRASLIDLHAEYINTLEKNPECSAWDLDEQSDADQKRLRRNAAHAISIVEPPIYLQAEQRATKIKALEDAHKRSGVKYAKIINELRSSVYANIPGLKKQWDEILNAPANGKIGPDAEAAHRECQECSEEFCDEDECPKPRKEDVPKHCYYCGKSMEDVNGDLCKGDYFIGAILLDPGQEESRYDPPIDASYYFACPGCAKVWLKERGQE